MRKAGETMEVGRWTQQVKKEGFFRPPEKKKPCCSLARALVKLQVGTKGD